MPIQTIAAIWDDFEAKVLDPIHAPDFQRNEMRKAFYGGAAAVLTISAQIVDNIKSEEAGACALQALEREVIDFAVNLDPNNTGARPS